jgi:triacylglycerol esterase/lipase EstA (alpha/beta hydrolase family)
MKRKAVKILSLLAPNLVVNFAYKMITTPQISKLRPHELDILDTEVREIYPYKGFDIQCYIWTGGNKKILLVHGWEGQAGNFADIILRLQKENYTIYAFDGPSHGFSSKGKTSLMEFTELVGIFIDKFEVSDIISHSFGGVATTYALFANQNLKIDKYILITTPDKFIERIDYVAHQVGITKRVKSRLIQRLEKETNMEVNLLNVSEFVKQIQVNKAWIFHDIADKIIPITQSRAVLKNWKNAELIEITGTGHFRILRTPWVIDSIIQKLKSD